MLKSSLRGDAPIGRYIGGVYDAPDAHLYLSFAAQSDWRPTAFQYFHMQVYLSPDQGSASISRIYDQTDAIWGSEPWEKLEVADGRFKGTFKYEARSARQRIMSRSPGCSSGDIGGECYCAYEPLLIPVVVDVDVALPQ